jgi:hypothetical protein
MLMVKGDEMAKQNATRSNEVASNERHHNRAPWDVDLGFERIPLEDLEADRRITRIEDAFFLGSFLRGSRALEA